MIWEHFVSAFKRDNKRSIPLTKLNADCIYLNNFTKMRVNLAVNTLCESVAREMQESENDATKSTQKYIQVSAKMFDILNSQIAIKDCTDERIAEIEKINRWFFEWETELEDEFIIPSEIQKHNISWQTIQDTHLTLSSFIDLLKYIFSQQFQEKYPSKPYIIPKRLNQDIVEGWFSHQRGCCGDNREPTVLQYGYNNMKLLSISQAKSDIANTNYGTASIQQVNGTTNDLQIINPVKR